MSSFEIPLIPSVGLYQVTTTIEETDYIFDNVRWNTRDLSWYFDVLEVDETPIILGARIVLGCYIGRRSNHPFFRRGVLIAVDLSGQSREATFDDLGVRVALQYIPVLDLIMRIQQARIALGIPG